MMSVTDSVSSRLVAQVKLLQEQEPRLPQLIMHFYCDTSGRLSRENFSILDMLVVFHRHLCSI